MSSAARMPRRCVVCVRVRVRVRVRVSVRVCVTVSVSVSVCVCVCVCLSVCLSVCVCVEQRRTHATQVQELKFEICSPLRQYLYFCTSKLIQKYKY